VQYGRMVDSDVAVVEAVAVGEGLVHPIYIAGSGVRVRRSCRRTDRRTGPRSAADIADAP
jgi:hypothetical protein